MVVDTRVALESMTDRTKFELLATSILRKADPKCAAVIHSGVNAHGETIVSPVDGLVLVPHSDPPHYILVQHTTTDRRQLRENWLSGEDADLPKGLECRGGMPEVYRKTTGSRIPGSIRNRWGCNGNPTHQGRCQILGVETDLEFLMATSLDASAT